MDEETLARIEREISVFVRRIVISEKRLNKLERSAYIILRLLSTHGPAGVKTLSNILELDISTISRQAATLEKKGYADKLPNPSDGRSYYYQITDLGTKELAESKQSRLDRLTTMLDGWSDEECLHFGKLLKKYNQTIEGKTDLD